MPWLSALFIFLLLLFIWGVFNKFQNTPSPQVKSIPAEIKVSSQSKQPDISIPKNTIPKQSQPYIPQRTRAKKIKPKITSTKSYSPPRAYSYNFPLNSCGDKDPGSSNSWYPLLLVVLMLVFDGGIPNHPEFEILLFHTEI